MCWSQYPRGVAELVGYWVEAEVFGGTVVFEHDADEEIIVCISLQDLDTSPSMSLSLPLCYESVPYFYLYILEATAIQRTKYIDKSAK